MESTDEIPTLLQLMFGEAAGTALRGASPRLLAWCRAFDDWLVERLRDHSKNARQRALHAWCRLLQNCSKMPWEMVAADFEQHVERMKAGGLGPSTIYHHQTLLSEFYRWCAGKGIDPECEPSFNPAASVPRPQVRKYQASTMLSRAEVEALLRTLRADCSPLGLRDYAFILASLQMGVPLHQLRRLQWGQLRVNESGAWVRWRPEAEPSRLPDEAWEAIRHFLEESGRLPVMADDTFVFTTISDFSSPDPGRKPQDWSNSHLGQNRPRINLKTYGRLAGIPDEKLTFPVLRRTALRMRLDAGDTPEQVHAYLGHSFLSNTRDRLRRLPPLPADPPGSRQEHAGELQLPVRRPHNFSSEERYIHGFYARSQPLDAVRAVIAENIQGIDEQIAGLRALGRGLLEFQLKAGIFTEEARLMEMYEQTAGWISQMLSAENQLAKRGEEQPWDDFLDHIEKYCLEEGEILDREALAAEALGTDPSLDLSARHLREELATLRFNLRNTLRKAAQAQEAGEYLRMVFLYGRGSVRLASLLRREKEGQGQLSAYLEKIIDEAIEEVLEGWKID